VQGFKLTPDGLGLQWNEHSETIWNLTFKLLRKNIAPLHFKTERVAETALRASWFWQTSAKLPGTWGIFSIPGDSELTPDGLALQWNGHGKTFWTLTFELLGPNIAPIHLKTERVAVTALRAWWFWPTWSRSPEIWGIFSSHWDSKVTPDGLVLQWNNYSKSFWTLTFELVSRNIALLHYNTERAA